MACFGNVPSAYRTGQLSYNICRNALWHSRKMSVSQFRDSVSVSKSRDLCVLTKRNTERKKKNNKINNWRNSPQHEMDVPRNLSWDAALICIVKYFVASQVYRVRYIFTRISYNKAIHISTAPEPEINTVGSPNSARHPTLRIWCVNQILNNIRLPVLFSHMLHQQVCTRLI